MNHMFMNEQRLAARLSVRPETLRKWRGLGKGPAFVKLGRTVRYGERDVEGWLASQMRGGESGRPWDNAPHDGANRRTEAARAQIASGITEGN